MPSHTSRLSLLSFLLILSCDSGTATKSTVDASTAGDGDMMFGGDGDGDGDEVDPDPILCGGAYEDPCAVNKYCHWTDGCGTVGNCFGRDNCELGNGMLICGCDGKTYEDDCAARQKGISWAHEGACLPVARQFECGSFTCDNDSYCFDKGERRAEGGEERYACLLLPDGCGPDRCDCDQKLDQACYVGSTCKVEGNHLLVKCK